jgi:hypothetical protein
MERLYCQAQPTFPNTKSAEPLEPFLPCVSATARTFANARESR